jgi:hypothetical protein
MKKLRLVVVATLMLVLLFIAATLLALEGSEVAVLHTAPGGAAPRATRVWIADHDGSAWIEAASPQREFYRDILADENVELARRGRRLKFRAVPVAGPHGHELIRSLLRRKYGWADAWIGLLADTSNSVAIRLEER